MSVELKIKSKHLSEEAKIIRFEEKKILKQVKWEKRQHEETGANEEFNFFRSPAHNKWVSLNSHRRKDVRNENRATFLARAFLAGKDYKEVEAKRKPEKECDFNASIMPRAFTMILKYNGKHIPKEIWVGTFPDRKKIENPEYTELKKKVYDWANAKY